MVNDPRRILLVRPSALGDVCRTAPVLASLRRRYPEARIDWLVRDAYADAIRAHPDLTDVVPFDRQALSRWWTPGGARRARRFLRELRSRAYDLVLDCQGLARSGLFTRAAGAPQRIGFREASEFAWMAYTQRVKTEPSSHVVDRMLKLATAADAEAVPDMRLYTPAETNIPEEALDGASYALLAPTSVWPGKCWPAERFASLAERLLDEGLADKVLVVGAGSEADQCAPVRELAMREPRVVDLIGRTSVAQLMAVVERAALVAANDSAAMHMAVGYDRPLVALLGPTDADLAGPYGRRDAVVQRVTSDDRLTSRACKDERSGSALMARITVEDALTAARRAVSETPGPEAMAEASAHGAGAS